jgi:predicted metalloprotease
MKVKVKLSLCLKLITHFAMKACGGVVIEIYLFLTPTIVGNEEPASRPG